MKKWVAYLTAKAKKFAKIFSDDCPIHGEKYLFRHGYDNVLDCEKCWQESREKYLGSAKK